MLQIYCFDYFTESTLEEHVRNIWLEYIIFNLLELAFLSSKFFLLQSLLLQFLHISIRQKDKNTLNRTFTDKVEV